MAIRNRGVDIVATGSYYRDMEQIKTVGIKALKNQLSAYLQDVKRGWRILITDRDRVVAELREPLAAGPAVSENPLREQWIREGKLRPALRPKTPLPRTGLRLPDGTAQRLIDEDRGD